MSDRDPSFVDERRIDLPGWLYNVAPARDHGQVEREIRAMLAHREHPKSPPTAELRLVEAIGYPLPKVKGYTLFRDRSTEARANVAAYIRDDLAGGHRWIDLEGTWPKTDHPGQHPPRSFLLTDVGQCRGIVAHQPPPFTRRALPKLQREGQAALTRAMNPRLGAGWSERTDLAQATALARPRWTAYDANANADAPDPSPGSLARAIGGKVAGDRIDCIVYRGCEVTEHEYVEVVDGVRLRTDHEHAFRYTITVPAQWGSKETGR